MTDMKQIDQVTADITHEEFVASLNADLALEYQAIISYAIYSQVLKGGLYLNIASKLEKFAQEELSHAMTITRQIDYLGGVALATHEPVATPDTADDMLWFSLNIENAAISRYQLRVRQCEAVGQFAMAQQIREILVQEQEHQITLARALGKQIPSVFQIE